jgi:phage/plasmid-associated DNA primase
MFVLRNAPEVPAGYKYKTFDVIEFDYFPDLSIKPEPMTWDNWADGWEIQEFEHALDILFSDSKRDTKEGQKERWWEWMGYLLSNYVHLKKAALYRGEPDTGKTTLTDIQLYILKDRYTEQTFHDLCDPKRLGITGALYRKNLCYDDEIGNQYIKTYERFKKITGHESMDVRYLFRNPFTGMNTCKFQGSVNQIPPVKSISTHFTNRWIIFFFDHVFLNDEKDNGFKQRMCTPKVARYIIRKAIIGLRRLINRGYFTGMNPEEVLYYWALESNVVFNFLETCCIKDAVRADCNPQAELYNHFVKFCETTTMDSSWVTSQAKFTIELKRFGYQVVNGGEREVWNPEKAENKTVHVNVYNGVMFNINKYNELINPDELELDITIEKSNNDIEDEIMLIDNVESLTDQQIVAKIRGVIPVDEKYKIVAEMRKAGQFD